MVDIQSATAEIRRDNQIRVDISLKILAMPLDSIYFEQKPRESTPMDGSAA